MKKNAIVFGLIAGLVVSAFMIVATFLSTNQTDFGIGMILGYTGMILAFSLIFVGVKNYRDKYNHGVVSFGKAFRIGLYITLIASTFYVVTWMIDYYFFIPEFLDKYSAHMAAQVKASGLSQVEMDKKLQGVARYKEMYKNPLFVALITYFEILPVGLAISLLSAGILKRRRPVVP